MIKPFIREWVKESEREKKPSSGMFLFIVGSLCLEPSLHFLASTKEHSFTKYIY